MRTATTPGLTLGLVVGILGGIGIVFGISRRDTEPQPPPRFEIAALDREVEPSSSTTAHEAPPPPEGPFYASLFVAGATWTLPCRFGDGELTSIQRCRVESVEVKAKTATARIACWYGDEPIDPAINTYVMTPTGLYEAATAPSTRGEPMFTPHPVTRSLPNGWGSEEPREPGWAHAIVRHHAAWCTVDDFQSSDMSTRFTECISRRGIVGMAHRSLGGLTERCGDAP